MHLCNCVSARETQGCQFKKIYGNPISDSLKKMSWGSQEGGDSARDWSKSSLLPFYAGWIRIHEAARALLARRIFLYLHIITLRIYILRNIVQIVMLNLWVTCGGRVSCDLFIHLTHSKFSLDSYKKNQCFWGRFFMVTQYFDGWKRRYLEGTITSWNCYLSIKVFIIF